MVSGHTTNVVITARPLQGLERLEEYDFVAVFDADFKPDSDFLVSSQAACHAFCENVMHFCECGSGKTCCRHALMFVQTEHHP